MTNMQNKIEVVIPPQEYDYLVYTNASDCYLSQAVKKLGYKRVLVGPMGTGIEIDGVKYETDRPFSSTVLKDFFERNEPLRLNLISSVTSDEEAGVSEVLKQ